MKKKVLIIITLTVVIGVVGCATLPMESHLEKPVSMTQISDTANVSENKFVRGCFERVKLRMSYMSDIVMTDLQITSIMRFYLYDNFAHFYEMPQKSVEMLTSLETSLHCSLTPLEV